MSILLFPLPIGACHLTLGHLHFLGVALRTVAQFFLRPPPFVEFHPMEDGVRTGPSQSGGDRTFRFPLTTDWLIIQGVPREKLSLS